MRGALQPGTAGSLPAAGRPRPRQKQPGGQDGVLRARSRKDGRRLEDLISVGPAMVRDFELLGVHGVAQLAKRDPRRLYHELERLTGQRQDPCVLDTFCAAVAQARNPRLEAAQCEWWWWSRKRKQEDKKSKK